jgi:putative RecB family exonuclease
MNNAEGWLPAEVLSPTQATQFLNCPAKWYFKYFLDLEEPATSATALGRAFHETIAHNFRRKIETRTDLSVDESLEHFRTALGQHLEHTALRRDEHPVELMDLGAAMIEKYMREAAPLIQPAAVETRVSGVIGGVKIQGFVDLLDVDGRIVDSKSALKPMKGLSHDHRFQLTSYVMITPQATGACRLDTVTKSRTVSLVQKTFDVNADDRRYAENIYPMVQDSIREGIFVPRSSSALCSRGYCGFWRVCEREFGGSVRPE